ncbi:MAG TPA: chemotaxis protein CheW [Acidobacteriota bacterium]|nr:chemotaxis protein CheW [Acidobacteriota bacterium]
MQSAQARVQKSEDLSLQFVTFEAGGQHFAAEIKRVKEILRYRKITPLPKAPAFLEGVIDLRGNLIPIVDLRKRFDVEGAPNDQTRIIILRWKRKRIGLIVDAVDRVLTVPLKDIQAPPPLAQVHGSRFMLAVARHLDQLYVILDLDRILSTAEAISLEQVQLS